MSALEGENFQKPSVGYTQKANLTACTDVKSILHTNRMFCCTCIIVNQYSKTNVTHFSFNLFRVKASACFGHYLLVLRRRSKTALGILCAYNVQSWHSQLTIYTHKYTKCRFWSASRGWASNARNMQRPWLLINWKKSALRWFYNTDTHETFLNRLWYANSATRTIVEDNEILNYNYCILYFTNLCSQTAKLERIH
jgi:hypothetical protein